MYKLSLIAMCFFSLVGCSKEDGTFIQDPRELIYDFSLDAEGWQGDFADYPEGEETFYQLDFGFSRLPSPLDTTQGSLKQTGSNHSDDLFMFVKRKLTGLTPNQIYQATFDIEIASNAANGSVGVGGSPGEGVYIKAGMTQIEPLKELENSSGHYRMNIDKGNQATDGLDMVLIGNFANGTDENVYAFKTLSNTIPFEIQSDRNGEVWVIIGTDSGFEAITTIYYNKISITLE